MRIDPDVVAEAPVPAPDPVPEVQTPEPESEAESEPEPPSYDFSAVDPIIADFVEENDLNGAGFIVVQRDDGVIYESYWGVFDEDRISLIASSSKMITAGVLLRLDDEGLLDIDAPVADVVDWGTANPDITPAQLISNSSGLVGLLPNPVYAPYLCQYIPAGTLQSCGETIFTTAADDADIVSPDVEFRYGGAQWQVAGAVAEVASGKSWAELIDEIYVQPCGLDVLAYNNPFAQIGSGGLAYPTEFDSDPSTLAATENPNMEGGVYVTAGDYAALLLMHLRDGMCGDTRVLSSEALDRMHSDRILEAYDGSASPGSGYGMGWWIDRVNGRISDGGAYGSVPWLDLEDGYGAYLVVEADFVIGGRLAGLLYDVVEDAVRSR
jgi:CubicO group peptidase (beta-lactamase class C family)